MVNIINNEVQGLPTIKWAHGKPTMIIMHEVGNNNSTVNGEIKYMANHYQSAFYHAIAAKDGLHIVHDPDKGGAWGAGQETHNYAIHIEQVRYDNEDDFNKAYQQWIGGAKHFANKYNIPTTLNKGTEKKGIVTHHYVTNTWGGTTHTDPDAYLKQHGKSIDDLANDLGASKGESHSAHKSHKSSTQDEYKGNSVVDYLKHKGEDSSFPHRSQLASKYGISNYRGTQHQNTQLLNALRNGKSPSKSIKQMAQEVIDGKHGNGNRHRRKSLGVSKATYNKVRDKVNQMAGGNSKSISQMADEVIKELHGNGNAHRRKSLGVSKATYRKVRKEVNRKL